MKEINPGKLVPHEKYVTLKVIASVCAHREGGPKEATLREVMTLGPLSVNAMIHMG